MKKSKHTEEQIAFALRQAQTGTRAEEICRKFGVSQATFYNWKKKYGGLDMSELRRLKQLEAESSRLKRLVADLGLDKEMLRDVIQKSYEASSSSGVGASHGRCVIYCEEGRNLRRRRPRRRVAAAHRMGRPEISTTNECWSMDFVADNLFNGHRIRALTLVILPS